VEKVNIKVEPQKCTQCSCCQLSCSLLFTGAFNPEKARIVISAGDPPESITFTDECVAKCSLCTRYCPVGAIAAV